MQNTTGPALGVARVSDRDFDTRAATRLLSALRAMRELDIAVALSHIAAHHIALDRWDDGRAHAREALFAAREARCYTDVAWMLQHLAAIAALAPAPGADYAVSRREGAATLLGYVDRHIDHIGASRGRVESREYERALSALRACLDDERLAACLAEGRAMTLNAAFEHALSL